jgi:hypothetical protein
MKVEKNSLPAYNLKQQERTTLEGLVDLKAVF